MMITDSNKKFYWNKTSPLILTYKLMPGLYLSKRTTSKVLIGKPLITNK